jgi:hypothetical protein
MRKGFLFLIFLLAFFKSQSQTKPSGSKKTGATVKPAIHKSAHVEVPQKKIDTVPVVPKKVITSINLDKYLSYQSEELAIREIDSLYSNTIFTKIENSQGLLFNRKFNLIYHLIDKYEVKPGIDYLYDLNKYDFVCGVGLKRSKAVSPACLQPRVYVTNLESENKVKLAALILTKGIKADFESVKGCIGKNEVELFKLLYTNLVKENFNSTYGEKLLVDACDYGCYDIVKYLLENKVSPNGYDHTVEQQDFKFYAIYRAVKYPEIFFFLIEKGADINIKGYRNTTAIIHAAREGCIEVLQYLLDKGIDPNEKQGDLSAYDMAKKYNQKNKKEVIELFKKYKNK